MQMSATGSIQQLRTANAADSLLIWFGALHGTGGKTSGRVTTAAGDQSRTLVSMLNRGMTIEVTMAANRLY